MSTVAEILVVDDTRTNIKLLNSVLSDAGYTTRVALSGQQALHSIATHPPDLVLLDIQLPDINGYTVCQQLRLNPDTADLPVIFLSALHDESDKVRAFEVGGVDYIIKPYYADELLARINFHLTTQRLQKQLVAQNQHIQQQDATLRAIFAAVPDLLMQIGADGTYLNWFNRGNMQSFVDGTSCLGQNIREFLPADLVERRMYYVQKALETGETQIYEQEVNVNGTIQFEECRITKITDEDVLVIVRDITDWERAKRELKQAKDTAEQANVAKSQFLANMSHELRTPLNGILGFAQLLTYDAALTEDQRESLDAIQHAGEHLLELVNDLLEMSRMEVGKTTLQMNRFDLCNLLDDLALQFRIQLTEKAIAFHVHCDDAMPRLIETDERKLRQILINLLSNAIKFTDQGHITLRASVEYDWSQPPQVVERADLNVDDTCHNALSPQRTALHAIPMTLSLDVEDTGVGIAPEELPKLFQIFSQTESGKQSGQGTGLGLAISKRFAELMDGTIEVDSTPGVGTKFHVQIQAIALDTVVTNFAHRGDQVLGLIPGHWVPRILVVDNQPDNAKITTQILKQLGFEVQLASNGEEAIAQWQAWNPHLIFMDMQMPVMDGYEATRQIRQQATQPPHPAIIALTASAFKDQRERMKAAGCDDILCKPFRVNCLCMAIARHLGVRFRYRRPRPRALPTECAAVALSMGSMSP